MQEERHDTPADNQVWRIPMLALGAIVAIAAVAWLALNCPSCH